MIEDKSNILSIDEKLAVIKELGLKILEEIKIKTSKKL